MPRILYGVLNAEDWESLEGHLFIAKLACPLCSLSLDFLHLGSQGEPPKCVLCDFSVQPVLVLEKPHVDADESFWVVRLLPRDGVITPQQWQIIVEKQSLFVASLRCPLCHERLTGKNIHREMRKLSCCQFLFIPQLLIKEQDKNLYEPDPSISVLSEGALFLYIRVLMLEPPSQMQRELEWLRSTEYRHELWRFIPNDAIVEDVRDLQPPDPSLFAVETPTETNTPITDTGFATLPIKTQKMIDKEMIREFLSAWVVESRDAIIPRHVVYEKYQQWIRQQNREPVPDKSVYRQLLEVYPLVRMGKNRINGELIWCFRDVSCVATSKGIYNTIQ